jgi:16S rRNA (guanine527-N7)-methyltransferase
VEHPPGVTGGWLAERLAPFAEALGVPIPPGAAAPLARYLELVLAWRDRVNLTGARTREALVDEHVADAWALLPWLPRGPFRFVDVGAGAGLPGVILAVVRTDAEAVLLEPRQKRHAFLAHVVRELELRPRVEVRRERLEEQALDPRYDVAVSRATWPAAEWLELGLRLVRRPGGRVLGLEGGTPATLPPGAYRHPYRLGERRRAVLVRDA